MRIVVLAGGIGGARFLAGVRAWAASIGGSPEITAIVNTADDVTRTEGERTLGLAMDRISFTAIWRLFLTPYAGTVVLVVFALLCFHSLGVAERRIAAMSANSVLCKGVTPVGTPVDGRPFDVVVPAYALVARSVGAVA